MGQVGHITGAMLEYAPGHLHTRPCYVFSGRSSRIAVRRNFTRESAVETIGPDTAFFNYFRYGQRGRKQIVMDIIEGEPDIDHFRVRGVRFEEISASFFYNIIIKYLVVKFI